MPPKKSNRSKAVPKEEPEEEEIVDEEEELEDELDLSADDEEIEDVDVGDVDEDDDEIEDEEDPNASLSLFERRLVLSNESAAEGLFHTYQMITQMQTELQRMQNMLRTQINHVAVALEKLPENLAKVLPANQRSPAAAAIAASKPPQPPQPAPKHDLTSPTGTAKLDKALKEVQDEFGIKLNAEKVPLRYSEGYEAEPAVPPSPPGIQKPPVRNIRPPAHLTDPNYFKKLQRKKDGARG